jgi:hypothetical protein
MSFCSEEPLILRTGFLQAVVVKFLFFQVLGREGIGQEFDGLPVPG